MLLYVAEATAGVAFYRIDEMEERNAEWREWFEGLEDEDVREFQKHGVAFGEVVASGNYFVLWQGQVYYSDHDGGDDQPYGAAVAAFLDRIAADPARFLDDAGCYTRYGEEQWIPREYVGEMD